ncbi:MAG: hypothetical protein DMG96_35770 [Acidobacteria bacterium]|nr:MAG: hypothetical protein DMG96_35770 [Acidobacteriota bacterium]
METGMWSIIPSLRGVRAAEHWLRNAAPDKQAQIRKDLGKNRAELEHALGKGPLLRTFREVLGRTELLAKVEGMREGLELYEYGLRIQNKNQHAFRSIMKYTTRCVEKYEGEALGEALSAEKICDYLDEQLDRIATHKIAEKRIRPPKDWKCETWTEALRTHRNKAEKFIHLAKSEGLSKRYNLLMAWKTWCKEKSREATFRNDSQVNED